MINPEFSAHCRTYFYIPNFESINQEARLRQPWRHSSKHSLLSCVFGSQVWMPYCCKREPSKRNRSARNSASCSVILRCCYNRSLRPECASIQQPWRSRYVCTHNLTRLRRNLCVFEVRCQTSKTLVNRLIAHLSCPQMETVSHRKSFLGPPTGSLFIHLLVLCMSRRLGTPCSWICNLMMACWHQIIRRYGTYNRHGTSLIRMSENGCTLARPRAA